MRLYSFVLLASSAFPTSATVASRVSDSLTTKDNSTVMISPFNDEPNDPVKQLSTAHGTIDNEERMPRLSPPKEASELLQGALKTTVFKLYGSTSRQKLSSDDWDQVMIGDKNQLKRVKEKIRDLVAEQDVGKLRYAIRTAVANNRYVRTQAKKFAPSVWMHNKHPKDLVTVLGIHGFFQHFSFEKARVLEEYIGASDKARLFRTLSICFVSEADFAYFLSIAKQSLTNGHDAKLLQDKLLAFWIESERSVGEVLKLLKWKERGWTYATLDTLVEYVALRMHKKTNEVYRETIEYLRKWFGDAKIEEAIIKGEATVQSVTSYLNKRYKDTEIASRGVGFVDLAQKLKAELYRIWKAERINRGRLRKEFLLLPDTRYKHKPDLSLDLSLRPPGT